MNCARVDQSIVWPKSPRQPFWLRLRICLLRVARRVKRRRSGHIAAKSHHWHALPGSAGNSPARILATRTRTSSRTASSCSSDRVVLSRVADSVKYSVTRSGVPEAERVAAGQRVDRQLEALVDALLARHAAGLVVDDLDAARRQPVDPVDRAVDDDRRAAVRRLQAQLEVELLVERLADRGDLALPEVVEQGRDAPLVALLGDAVAEALRLPFATEGRLEVLARRRRLASRRPLAAVLRERLERGVGRRAEAERRRRDRAARGSGRRTGTRTAARTGRTCRTPSS